MNIQNDYHRQIALGWVAILAMGVVMLLFMTLQSIFMDNNFVTIKADPGTIGLRFLTFLLPTYAVMPVVTYLVAGSGMRFLRWLIVVPAILSFIFNILHHLEHLVDGTRSTLSANMADLALHVLGYWVVYNSIRWARAGTAAASE